MKNIKISATILFGVVLAIGCSNIFALTLADKGGSQPKQVQPSATTLVSSISYLTSKKDNEKYCNGWDMDGKEFRKTITKLVTVQIPQQYLTREEVIKKTIVLASEANDLTTVVNAEPNFLKVRGNTAYIMPIDGWAGVSIFMCAWEPLVEVNLLRFPEIKKIIWSDMDESLDDWNKL